ncbi:MAG: hypothetical protein V1899_02760 [Planctomycetota bacterium]
MADYKNADGTSVLFFACKGTADINGNRRIGTNTIWQKRDGLKFGMALDAVWVLAGDDANYRNYQDPQENDFLVTPELHPIFIH